MKTNILLWAFLGLSIYLLFQNQVEQYILALILYTVFNLLYKHLDKSEKILCSFIVFTTLGVTALLSNHMVLFSIMTIISTVQILGYIILSKKSTKTAA